MSNQVFKVWPLYLLYENKKYLQHPYFLLTLAAKIKSTASIYIIMHYLKDFHLISGKKWMLQVLYIVM